MDTSLPFSPGGGIPVRGFRSLRTPATRHTICYFQRDPIPGKEGLKHADPTLLKPTTRGVPMHPRLEKGGSVRGSRQVPIIIENETSGRVFRGMIYRYNRDGLYLESDYPLQAGTVIKLRSTYLRASSSGFFLAEVKKSTIHSCCYNMESAPTSAMKQTIKNLFAADYG